MSHNNGTIEQTPPSITHKLMWKNSQHATSEQVQARYTTQIRKTHGLFQEGEGMGGGAYAPI